MHGIIVIGGVPTTEPQMYTEEVDLNDGHIHFLHDKVTRLMREHPDTVVRLCNWDRVSVLGNRHTSALRACELLAFSDQYNTHPVPGTLMLIEAFRS